MSNHSTSMTARRLAMPDLQALLDHIQQIEKHTRSGPWELHPVNDSQLYATYVAGSEADSLEPKIAAVVSGFDAEFIALARTALPQLAAVIRRLRECAQTLTEDNNDASDYASGIHEAVECFEHIITDALGADDDLSTRLLH